MNIDNVFSLQDGDAYHIRHFWQNEAHQYFDILWRVKVVRGSCSMETARGEAYKWLAHKMNLRENKCHMKHMNIKQCQKVVEICKKYDLKKMHKEVRNYYK